MIWLPCKRPNILDLLQMSLFDEIPQEFLDNCSEEVADSIRELMDKIDAGEAPKGVIRLQDIEGRNFDFAWGYEDEEEKDSMLALLDKEASGATVH